MKVAFVVLSVLATFADSIDPDVEFMKQLVMASLVCKRKTEFKNVDLQSIVKGVPQTRTAQCFIACMWKEMGVITDNKLNMTKIKTLKANYRKTNPVNYDVIIKVHEACTKVTDKDECVAVTKISNCVTQGFVYLLKMKESLKM